VGHGCGNISPCCRRSRQRRGLWRSLVAHLTGGQVVAGSNPVSPTNERNSPAKPSEFFHLSWDRMPGAEAPAEVRGGRAGGSCQPDKVRGTFRISERCL
jgi:hypothetical protein